MAMCNGVEEAEVENGWAAWAQVHCDRCPLRAFSRTLAEDCGVYAARASPATRGQAVVRKWCGTSPLKVLRGHAQRM